MPLVKITKLKFPEPLILRNTVHQVSPSKQLSCKLFSEPTIGKFVAKSLFKVSECPNTFIVISKSQQSVMGVCVVGMLKQKVLPTAMFWQSSEKFPFGVG
jgi:hypothetical protein